MAKNMLIDHATGTPWPSVGETWISKDKRDNGRTVTIDRVDGNGNFVIASSSTSARKTHISIETLVARFKKKESR